MKHRTSHSSVSALTCVQLPTTVGLDLSDRVSHFHVLRGDGVKLDAGKVATNRASLELLFTSWAGCRLVLEAGGHSPWVSRLATRCGMESVVANPRRVQLISKSDRKTDRTDAELLARLGRSDVALLAPITHRSEQSQAHLAVQRSRNAVVSSRTLFINHVQGVLKSFGLRAPSCSPECFHTRAAAFVPESLASALTPILKIIGQLNTEIRGFDREMKRLCREVYPEAAALQQVPGVGPIVSLTFMLTLGSHERFASGRDVGPYVGLVPRKQSSGDSDPQLRITKAGDRELRRLLVLSANYILGRFCPDCDLRRFGMRIAGDGSDRKAKKRARVAVARKLAVLLHHLWRSGATYDPLHQAKRRGELSAA